MTCSLLQIVNFHYIGSLEIVISAGQGQGRKLHSVEPWYSNLYCVYFDCLLK